MYSPYDRMELITSVERICSATNRQIVVNLYYDPGFKNVGPSYIVTNPTHGRVHDFRFETLHEAMDYLPIARLMPSSSEAAWQYREARAVELENQTAIDAKREEIDRLLGAPLKMNISNQLAELRKELQILVHADEERLSA